MTAELGRVITSLLGTRSWPLLPKRVRLKRQVKLLKRSGLFDAQWYLEQYKDIAKEGVDPAWHYVAYGASERREPYPILAEAQHCAAKEK